MLSQCASAIKALHANGQEKDPESLSRILAAHKYLCDQVIAIVQNVISETDLQMLRTSLHELHPDIPYERPLSIARDLMDIAVTLDGMTEFSGHLPTGENFTAVRSNPIKIPEAIMFFNRLAEVQS